MAMTKIMTVSTTPEEIAAAMTAPEVPAELSGNRRLVEKILEVEGLPAEIE